ncbi:MAG: CHAT domain-containing protein [Pyrinomonadaceae bacterium]
MRRIKLTTPFAVLLLLSWHAAAAAQETPDEASVRAVVRQLFDAYAKADLEGFMATWSQGSPDYASRKEVMSGVFAGTRDIRLVSLSVGPVVLEGTRARTRVAAELTGVDAATGQPAPWLGALKRSVLLVKEDGRWKIWRYVPIEQALADALSTAADAEERRRLFASEAGSVTPDLVRMLLTSGDAQATGGDLAGGLRAIEIAFEAAEIVNTPTARGWCHWFRGGVYENRTRYEEALKDYGRAVALFREAKDAPMTANLLKSVAVVRNRMGSPKEGIAAAEEALALARGAGRVQLQMEVLNTLGMLRDNTGDYAAALAAYSDALKIARESKRRADESAVLSNMGVVYRRAARYEDALRAYGESLEIERELKSETGVAQARLNIAVVNESRGSFKEALALYDELLKFFRARGLKQEESIVLNNVGSVRIGTGDFEGALAAFEESLVIKRANADKSGESVTLNNIANVYQLTARYARAAELYARSLELKRAAGDRAGVAAVLNNLGTVHKSAGNFVEAREALEQSLAIAREIGDPAAEAKALNNIGLVNLSAGEFARALLSFDQSLKISRAIGARDVQASTLQNIGIVYNMTGRNDDALVYYEQAAALEAELGNKAGLAALLSNRATVYEDTGRHDDARAESEKSLAVARQLGDRLLEAQSLHNIAASYVLAGRYAEALPPLEAGLKIVRDAGDRDTEAVLLNALGKLYLETGKTDDARRALAESLAITEKSGDVDTAIHSHHQLGDLHRRRKDWARAADEYRRAVERVELIRTRTREHTMQIGLFGQYSASYFGLAESLMGAGDEAGAFDAGERAKARSLVDLMQGGGAFVKAVTPEERREEQRLTDDINALTLQLEALRGRRDADPAAVARLGERLAAARAEYEEYSRKLFLQHPELQARRAQFEPASLAQLGRALFAGEPDLCLLSYFVGKDETLLFVATRGLTPDAPARLATFRLPLKHREAAGLLRQFRSKLGVGSGERGARGARPAVRAGHAAEARALYDALLAPAEKELEGKSHLVIIPDLVLSSLPFHALMDVRKEYVVKRYAVSYAPSATALLMMRARRDRPRGGGSPTILALGRPRYVGGDLPDLPATEKEVRDIAQLFGARPLLGAEASEARVKTEAAGARYLHFATHGLLNEAAPMYSAVALAGGGGEDGALHARELMGMNLSAELAVLSACDTALGQEASGEGVLGLTWSLFVAGVPASVVSQWKVADDSTSELMVEFYRQLKSATPRGGVSKAEALRRAQLKLLADGKHSHPYYWAPFVLMGEWRN